MTVEPTRRFLRLIVMLRILRVSHTLGMLFLDCCTTMHRDEITRGSTRLRQTAVEVQIWEGYLLNNRINVGKTLCTYSLDNGPVKETAEGALTFRFTAFDWEKNIQQLLSTNNIHFDLLRNVPIHSLHQLLRKKIYIVEDNPETLDSLSTMLEDAGYQVRVSNCGKPIIDGNFSSVDLFILAKQMHDIDGLNICRYLRAQSATKDTPVILISAHPKSGNEALQAGANDYIEKPFEMHYLLNVVSRYVKRI